MKGPIDISTAVQAAALALDSALTPGPDGFLDSGTIQGAATAARAILNALGEGMAAEYDRILEATGAWPASAVAALDLLSTNTTTVAAAHLIVGSRVRINGGTWRIDSCQGDKGNEGGPLVFLAVAGRGEWLELSRERTDLIEIVLS